MTTRPFTIALSGKGGTGKTTISSLLVRAFIDAGETPVLAVDADPNANFHEALGVEVKETLGSMREEAFTRNIPPGMNRHDYVRFRFRQALVESKGFDLVAMGRPEGHRLLLFCERSSLGMHAAARTGLPFSRDRYRSRHGAYQPGDHREAGPAPDRK